MERCCAAKCCCSLLIETSLCDFVLGMRERELHRTVVARCAASAIHYNGSLLVTEEIKPMTQSAAPPDGPSLPMDNIAIQRILPHRYPMLLIDRVVEMEQRKRIVAIKSVTINEPFFGGHFPNFPIMPGVLIVEA